MRLVLLLCLFATTAWADELLFADGIEDCSMMDPDHDRVRGCHEIAIGTNPGLPDTDLDGLSDGDEMYGTLGGLDLPKLGVKPTRRDVLVEMDWIDDASECAAHTHRPSDIVITEVKAFFAAAPLVNVDGSTGINLIVDYGQGGLFTGGSLVSGGPNVDKLDAIYAALKLANFTPPRQGYFRYQLQAHRYAAGSSGYAEIVGDDGLVTLYCLNSDDNVRNTIIHELGHNLGLDHGGGNKCNGKPNYDSLMNYYGQFAGVDPDCDGIPNGIDYLGYSAGKRPPIDENAIDEAAGVCGLGVGAARDWNANGVIDGPYARDLNGYSGEQGDCGGLLTVLTDHDDWAKLNVAAGISPPSGGATPPNFASCATPPEQLP